MENERDTEERRIWQGRKVCVGDKDTEGKVSLKKIVINRERKYKNEKFRRLVHVRKAVTRNDLSFRPSTSPLREYEYSTQISIQNTVYYEKGSWTPVEWSGMRSNMLNDKFHRNR